jgi:integrase
MTGGFTFKRCSCPPVAGANGRPLACKRKHGSWFFAAESRTPDGKRRQVRRGGFATQGDAQLALTAFAEARNTGQLTDDRNQTVSEFVYDWLAKKIANGLRPTTARGYRQHIDTYIAPVIGTLRLRDVRPPHVEDVLTFAARPKEKGKTPGPATVRRVHATMRSVFASAKRQRYIPDNPAVDVDLPKAARPTVRPWEAVELGRFLDHAAGDRLGPLYEVAAFTGLRRGELLGLRWQDVDLDRSRLTVRQQIVQLGHETHIGPVKTSSGQDRVVDLDATTVGALLSHRLRQEQQRATWAEAWVDSGHVFTKENGSTLHPETVTKRFRELSDAAGLRPVRLHDLRHGQASLMLAAGVPMAVVSKRLGHSSIAITSDTYSHLLEGVGLQAATAAAELVPRGDRRTQNEPNSIVQTSELEDEPDIAAGQWVGRLGIEPRTRGLKVRCSAG